MPVQTKSKSKPSAPKKSPSSSGKFLRILQRANSNKALAPYQKSKKWYRNIASKVQRVNRKALFMNNANESKVILPGHMYLYFYDPKHKDTLPYYDIFPLIFPIEMYSDGFLGINLHYLPHGLRARLMDALYDLMNNDKKDQTTKLKISYNILKNAAKYKYFKPCVKRYLYSHLRSNFIRVNADEWEQVLLLPLEQFKKKSTANVWKESRRKIK